MDRSTKRGRSKQRNLERDKTDVATPSGRRLTRSKATSARGRSSSSESVVIPGPLLSEEEENTDLESVSAAEEEEIVEMTTTATVAGPVEAPPAVSAVRMVGMPSTSSSLMAGVMAGAPQAQQERGERNYGRSSSLAASSAAVSRWVDAESLIAVLYDIQRMNFSVAAQRALMFTQLDGIKPVEVGFFGRNRRFPENRIYVNMNEATVGRYLQQLYAGLSYKEFDRVADNNAGRGGTSGGERQQSRVDSQRGRATNDSNDSHMGYMNAVTQQLASKIASGELSYDRRKFEREYNLLWELWVGGK